MAFGPMPPFSLPGMKEDLRQRILDAVPIDQFIGRTVSLKRQGRYLKGLCPFHGEKTPSFTVTPEKGIYHCFGCGRSGDLFSYVMEKEGVGFPEAIEILAQYAGIPLDTRTSGDGDGAQLELLARARSLFHAFLNGPDGTVYRRYLEGRGIGEATIERFRLGASPDNWQWLSDQFPGQDEALVQCGLARKSDQGRIYDFFRDRVLFPIEDLSDRCLGFGGRVLASGDQPKYINTPDTPYFHKGRTLYGLNRALPLLRAHRRAILVEGYLDVIGMVEADLGGAVAPLGTAFTEDHRNLLGRYADETLVFLDGDRAGRAAAAKASRVLMEGKMSARVLFLPGGADPFDFSRSSGAASVFAAMTEHAVPASRFALLAAVEGEGLDPIFASEGDPLDYMVSLSGALGPDAARNRLVALGTEGRKQAFRRLTEFLAGLDELSRELLLAEGAWILGVDEGTVLGELQRSGRGRPARPGAEDVRPPVSERMRTPVGPGANPAVVRVERDLLSYLFLNPDLFPDIYQSLGDLAFEDPVSETLWRILENRYLSEQAWTGDPAEMVAFPTGVRDLFLPLVLKHRQGGTDKITREILLELSIKHSLERVERELKEKESELQVAGDPGPVLIAMDGLQKEKLRLKTLQKSGIG